METNIILFLLILISAFCLGTMYNLYRLWVKYDELTEQCNIAASNTKIVYDATRKGQEGLARRIERLELKIGACGNEI